VLFDGVRALRWIHEIIGSICALGLAIIAALLSAETRSLIYNNLQLSIFLIFSIILSIVFYILWKNEKIKIGANPIPVKMEDIKSETKIIFPSSDISQSTEEIYHKFFKSKHEMRDEEYNEIERRGKFIRASLKIFDNRAERLVTGYYSIFPISKENFDSMLSGDLRESDITNDMVLDPDDPSAEVLYICEICSIDDRAAIALIYDLKKYIRTMCKKNPNLVTIGAWGFSKDGRKLCELMGMRKVICKNKNRPYFEMRVPFAQ
jgi:hypothetical protein